MLLKEDRMVKKVIAIGNILMGDDSIGIRVLEKIADSLKSYGIDSFIGETDFEYCISLINDGDLIIILDAAMLGKKIGTITKIPLEECINHKKSCTEHSASLIDLLYIYNKKVIGYAIGIQVEKIIFDLNMSKSMELLLNDISQSVLKEIMAST